jgi:2-phosphosulfolactate phosphatase
LRALDVVFTPAELGGTGAGDRTVIVLDVLRSTSTILEALTAGAAAVVPVESVEQAVAKAQEMGRDAAVLCGERDCLPIPGFHLGNSPLEFTAARVAGKTLVMTTTNGTRALLAGQTGARCLVGSLLNAGAAAQAAHAAGGDVLILCAGREGRFALEDALCAGMIANRILDAADGPRPRLNDGAVTARLLAKRHGRALAHALRRSAAGRRLVELDRAAEVEYCARLDLHARVPVVRDRRVTLS